MSGDACISYTMRAAPRPRPATPAFNTRLAIKPTLTQVLGQWISNGGRFAAYHSPTEHTRRAGSTPCLLRSRGTIERCLAAQSRHPGGSHARPSKAAVGAHWLAGYGPWLRRDGAQC